MRQQWSKASIHSAGQLSAGQAKPKNGALARLAVNAGTAVQFVNNALHYRKAQTMTRNQYLIKLGERGK
jgi:hypothetical protein